MFNLIFTTLELLFYHALVTLVDRISALPRHSHPPDILRLFRENLALKAQVEALNFELKRKRGPKPRVSVRARAAQAMAMLLGRPGKEFRRFHLSASATTLWRWLFRFRNPLKPRSKRGRKPTPPEVVRLILTMKEESPIWGNFRIKDELARMGIRISHTTVRRILRDHGLDPHRRGKAAWERYRSAAKDAMWALDFFSARLANGTIVKAVLIIDLFTREIIELKTDVGIHTDAIWITRTLAAAIHRLRRIPAALVHDRGPQFGGQFARQLRVMEIEQRRTPVALPFFNFCAERAIKSVRTELLNHIRPKDPTELQWYLDEYRRYYNTDRAHQALNGLTPVVFAAPQENAQAITLADVRKRKLERRVYAHGLLTGYSLVDHISAPIAA